MSIHESYHSMLLREEQSYEAEIEALHAQIAIGQKDLADVREELREFLNTGIVPQSFVQSVA